MKKIKGAQAPNPRNRRRKNYGGPKTFYFEQGVPTTPRHEYICVGFVSEATWKQIKDLVKSQVKGLLNLDSLQTELIQKGKKFLKKIWVRVTEACGTIILLDGFTGIRFSAQNERRWLPARSA